MSLSVGMGVRIWGEGEVIFVLRQRLPGGCWLVSPVCCTTHAQVETEASIRPCEDLRRQT